MYTTHIFWMNINGAKTKRWSMTNRNSSHKGSFWRDRFDQIARTIPTKGDMTLFMLLGKSVFVGDTDLASSLSSRFDEQRDNSLCIKHRWRTFSDTCSIVPMPF